MTPPTASTRFGWAGAVVVLAIGLALLLGRGTLPALGSAGMDTDLLMTASRTWLDGKNPYSVRDVARVGAEHGSDTGSPVTVRGRQVLVYPPGGWALWSPVSTLPDSLWVPVWTELNTVLWMSCAVGGVMLAGVSWRSPWAWALIGLTLGLGGAHTNLRLGQTSILVTAMVVWGEVLRLRGATACAGVMLGLGAAVKPQLAGLFLAYELVHGRWRLIAAATVTGFAINAIGAARMMAAGVDWLPTWRGNLHEFTVGGDADPTALGKWAFMVVNLSCPMRLVLHDRAAIQGAALAVIGALGAAYLWVAVRRRRAAADSGQSATAELTTLSMIGVVTLLAAYHRYYDTTLLVFPVALAVRLLADGRARERRLGIVTLAALALLMVPLPALLFQLQESGRIPARLRDHWLWQGAALSVHTWTLVVLGCWLMALRTRIDQLAEAAKPETELAP